MTVRICMLWEADLQRIANHETDAIPQAFINEQEVFSRTRFSSFSSCVWHRSVRLVKVRSNRSRITWLLRSQRLSRNLQRIETFEAMPNGRNCIRFEWQRCSRVLQAQRRKQWQRVKKPFSDSVACFYRFGKHSIPNWSLWADEDCRRLVGAVGVARPSLTDYQKAKAQYLRQCLGVGSVFEVEGAADDAPRVLFLVLALSGSGVKSPATDGQVEATTLGCHIPWQPLQMWRCDATSHFVHAVKGNLLEWTTWDKFERSLVRWRNMVVSGSFRCWNLQHKERTIPTVALEDSKCSVIVLARTLEAAGWASFTEELVHKPDDAVKQFSVAWFSSRRAVLPVLVETATDLGARSASHAVERLHHFLQLFAQW